jgi:hypothetical protein
VVSGVQALAARRRWPDVEALAAGLLDRREPVLDVLLIRGIRVEAAPLQRWTEKVAGGAAVRQAGLEDIQGEPQAALLASRLIAVFECGRVLEPAEIELVGQHFLPRPIESYAIVFTRAERLQTHEDLELMERAIWRALIPEPKADWRRQNLRGYRCYFWSEAAVPSHLAERCRWDRQDLQNGLQRPLSETDEYSLRRRRVNWLLDAAAACAPSESSFRHTEFERCMRADALARRRAQIGQLRWSLRALLDEDTRALGTEGAAAVLRLEQRMVRSIEDTLAQHRTVLGLIELRSAALDEVSQRLSRDLERQMTGLCQGLETELNAKASAAAARVLALLPSESAAAPRADAGPLDAGAACAAASPARLHFAWLARLEAAELPSRPPLTREAAAIALLGAAVRRSGLLVSILITGALSVAWLAFRRDRSLVELARNLRRAVHESTLRAIAGVKAEIQTALGSFRNVLDAQLERSQSEIDAQEERLAAAARHANDAFLDRERLLEYRRQF